MPYGAMTPEQQTLIRGVVAGREVLDIGAGDLAWAKILLWSGASHVIAVEKEKRPSHLMKGIDYVWSTYALYLESLPKDRRFDVGFLSWPSNYQTPGLRGLIERCDRLVYLGSNMNGTSCGTPEMFKALSHRSIETYIPWARNSLIVYGGITNERRPLVGEEYAGMFLASILTLEEAEFLARDYDPLDP